MHLEGERICEALVTMYKKFIASLIAFLVVAKGMAVMGGFHATPHILATFNVVVCIVWQGTISLPWPHSKQHVSWLSNRLYGC